MLPFRTPARQALLLFQLPRSPNRTKRTGKSSNPRLFTQNSQLLLISPASPRPQLPFLHNPITGRTRNALPKNPFIIQLNRLVSSENKVFLKTEARKAVKYTLYLWVAAALLGISYFGIQQERLERKYPSPPDWSWWSRFFFRNTRDAENSGAKEVGVVDWAKVGSTFRGLIKRLEDFNIDGQGLRPPLEEEGDIYVEGIGKTGLDIRSKSASWCQGYYQCLMGTARAAEHLENWVLDTSRGIAFPRDVVLGPSNQRPQPVPYGAESPPKEENCIKAFEGPEVYYMKILTTQGFTPKQRLDAALAYGDWLDFKGLSSIAEDIFNCAQDIAMGSLPLGINNIVDTKPGTINQSAVFITPNILQATTSLAIHHAESKNFSTALPIFLSVLRARRNLPPPPPSSSLKSTPQRTSSADPFTREPEPSTLSTIYSLFHSLIVPPPYALFPSEEYDSPAFRSPTSVCSEAVLQAHIGEILFASAISAPTLTAPTEVSYISSPVSSPKGEEQGALAGLSWTLSAINGAEDTLRAMSSELESRDIREAREVCGQCLEMGMGNWTAMVSRLEKAEAEQVTRKSVKANKGLFWSSGNGEEVKEEAMGKGRWENEREMMEERWREVRRLMRVEGVGEKPV
ncbi:MAG: hypothetical protein MMC33_006097 [Icmadophila ericetorum]|nr:hypothetical protein [Icmadophila ericetorum]